MTHPFTSGPWAVHGLGGLTIFQREFQALAIGAAYVPHREAPYNAALFAASFDLFHLAVEVAQSDSVDPAIRARARQLVKAATTLE